MEKEEKKRVIFDRVKTAKMMAELCGFVGLTLITEVECEFCNHKNKAKKDWVLRFGKDMCENCGEELPLEKIYGGPLKDYIDFVLKEEEPKKEKEAQKTDKGVDPIEKGLREYIKEIEAASKAKSKRKSVYEDSKGDYRTKDFDEY